MNNEIKESKEFINSLKDFVKDEKKSLESYNDLIVKDCKIEDNI